MNNILMRDYVVIAQEPNGDVRFLRATIRAADWKYVSSSIEERVLRQMAEDYPEARVIPATHKNGTGGAGWSEPYAMELGK